MRMTISKLNRLKTRAARVRGLNQHLGIHNSPGTINERQLKLATTTMSTQRMPCMRCHVTLTLGRTALQCPGVGREDERVQTFLCH